MFSMSMVLRSAALRTAKELRYNKTVTANVYRLATGLKHFLNQQSNNFIVYGRMARVKADFGSF